MKTELDSTLQQLSPDAKSAYADADKYFKEFNSDFGVKSQAGKVGANESEARATNALLANSDVARERTANVAQALQNAANSGDFAGAADLAKNFAESLGNTSRLTSRDYAQLRRNVSEAGETGSGNKTFQKTLRSELAKDMPQMQSVSDLGGGDQAAANQMLIDASKSLEGTPVNQPSLIPKVLNVVGKKVAGVPLGDVLTDPIARKVNLFTRITARDLANREFMANPNNLETLRTITRKIQDGTYQSDSALLNLTNMVANAGRAGALHDNQQQEQTTTTPDNSELPLLNIFGDVEPEQHAQSTAQPAPQPENKDSIDNLYDAISSAETGAEPNPWIRTKAAEGETSTAFGPLQITGTLAKDMQKQHGDQFTAEEKDYLKRFIQQCERMKKAPDNDPVYGYGAPGVLTSADDQRLYHEIGRKFLRIEAERNNGSLNKTVKGWRGKNDANYRKRVWNEFKKSQANNKTWNRPTA